MYKNNFVMAIVYKKREVTQKYTVIKLIKRYTLNRENSVQTVCKRQSDPEQNQGHLFSCQWQLSAGCFQEHSRRCLFYIFKYCGGKDANYFRQNNN